MNLTPHQKRQLKYVLLLLLGIPLTVFAVYKGIQLVTMASGDATPQEVIVSDITPKRFVISWFTEKEADGYVIPVLSGTEKSPVVDKRGTGKRQAHYVVLKSLEPATEYSFIIVSDNERYTKGSQGEYKFTTPPISEEVPAINPAYGTIKNADMENVLVYILLKDKSAYPVSTDIPSNGNWVADLSTFRSITDKSNLRVSDLTEVVVIAKEGLTKGSILEGSYSTLFNASGRLKNELVLEEIDISKISDYFPPQAILGNSDPIPQPQPQPVPTPTPTPTPVPKPQTYLVRHDVKWEDLTGGATTLDLLTGEESITMVNLTDIRIGVAWRSKNKEEGSIKYGTDEENLDEEMIDTRDSASSRGEYYSHLVESDRLDPDTTYYFEIYSGDDVYDNDGKKFSMTTFSVLDGAPPMETREVSLLNASDPTDWVLIFQLVDSDEKGTSDSSGLFAAIPDEDGSDVVAIGDVWSEDGSSYFEFSEDDVIRAYFLGKEEKKFDFNLSQNEIELDINELGGTKEKIELLLDYGIVKLK